MNKGLLVHLLVMTTMAALTACSSGSSIDSHLQEPEAAPVEMQVVQAPKSEVPATHNELLDAEFGCRGGGSLEYGVVQRPKKN